MDGLPVFIDDDEYIEITNVTIDVKSRLQLNLSMKRFSNDGLILYWGPSFVGQTSGNFISVMLVDSEIYVAWVFGELMKSLRRQTINWKLKDTQYFWEVCQMIIYCPNNSDNYAHSSVEC
ncbi:hypothetical protein KIN20_009470 [Parelaphostrongylus tenuis]|uniref:Uncharacterized protein n=1 Tax=Parelaphostrongylus tenuis TaxID=148309 RepID=A0AAD5MSK6_PARTN|nr:hypothetical protein KIN20_009470 [Parelaphostrongylus tenuis]